MCLSTPGRVAERWEAAGTPMAVVDFSGVRKTVCLAYVPEVEQGDYVLVHVGFALTKVDEQSALETLALIGSIELVQEPPELRDP